MNLFEMKAKLDIDVDEANAKLDMLAVKIEKINNSVKTIRLEEVAKTALGRVLAQIADNTYLCDAHEMGVMADTAEKLTLVLKALEERAAQKQDVPELVDAIEKRLNERLKRTEAGE